MNLRSIINIAQRDSLETEIKDDRRHHLDYVEYYEARLQRENIVQREMKEKMKKEGVIAWMKKEE